MAETLSDPRRLIPSVDRLLLSGALRPLLERVGRARLREALQAVQAEVRASLAAGEAVPDGIADAAWYAGRAEALLEVRGRPSLRPVINATGVVLHTNLGRAPLADAAIEAMVRVAEGYSNLEYDVEAGTRGSRHEHCVDLLRELTGAEAALVVNNNAAALVLALNTLAEGREAVVSRGELVEIGGSFRVPEIMARSGARMREVGATNRTHRADYEAALTDETAAILKVHRSNFRVIGFTSEVDIGTLAELARDRGVPLINDLGSGLIFPLDGLGLPPEPTAGEVLRAGADVVTMSGDKLLGGPQAGIILGRADLIARMRRNPLCRAFRVDKLTLAALEATLSLYRDPARARREVPVLRMMSMTGEEIAARASALARSLEACGIEATCVPGESAIGGGAFPGVTLPTTLVAIGDQDHDGEALLRALREGDPVVVARIVDGRVVLDPRTVLPLQEPALIEAVRRAAA